MAKDDSKISGPNFKKKRTGEAKSLRDFFLKFLKPKKMPVQEFSKVQSIPKPTAEHKSVATDNEQDGGHKIKTVNISHTKPLTAVGTSLAAQAEPDAGITIPKANPQRPNVRITAEGPTDTSSTIEDKGFKTKQSDAFTKPDVKKQTKVDKEIQLSLRYRMPKALVNLENKELKTLSEWVRAQIRDIEQERTEYMNRLLKYRAAWMDFVSTGMQPVWEGAHDIHVPVIFEKIKAMHSRIYQAVLGIDPPFSLKPKDKVNEVQKYEKEQLLNYVIKDYANFGRGWDGTIDKDIWSFVADGTSITKHSWVRDVRKYSDVEEEFTGFENGVPQYEDKEVEKEEIIFDGPMLKLVNIEDFYITGTNVDNPDEADLVGERAFYTKSELIKLAQQDFFFKDAIDQVLSNEPLNRNQVTNLDAADFKLQRDALAGVDRETSGHKVYEVFEIYCRYDIDKDGIDEELVVWFEKSSGLILRLTFLERACPGALRPFTIKRFIERPDSPYGIGMAEMMYGINNGIDYITNQRLDYGTLQNMPAGVIRATSGTKPKEIRLAPGVLIPVDDVNDIKMLDFRGGTAYGFQEEAAFTNYGDKVSGISGFNLGSVSGQGPTRTATGTAALVAEVNTNLDIHIKRFQRGYKRDLKILDYQVQKLLPLGLAVRIIGYDGKPLLKNFENRDAIRFSSDYELTANSVSSNKAIERETAGLLMQMLQNPLAIQGGLVSPKNLYNVYRNLLQKYEIKDIDAYITKPDEGLDSPFTAKDELTMILGGTKPPMYFRDRHAEKLAFFEAFEQSEEFSWYGPEQLEIYRITKKEHGDMMNAIQAQTQTPNLGGGTIDLNLAAQLAAGGGVPQGRPAQQMMDLMPSGPTAGPNQTQ